MDMNYLVIGGASGIGTEIIKLLLEEGNKVFTTYHEKEIDFEDANMVVERYNVLEDFSIDFLPDELHGVVYCPGKIELKPFHRIKEESILNDFQLQVMGAVRVLQKCYPLLKKAERSSVVLFSTVAVKIGFNFHTQVAISKGAVEGLVKSLSAEWAPKINVNAIAPSITNTPLAQSFLNSEAKMKANEERHPLKKIGEAKDIAEMAHFLLSAKAKWMTGQILAMDGGISSIK